MQPKEILIATNQYKLAMPVDLARIAEHLNVRIVPYDNTTPEEVSCGGYEATRYSLPVVFYNKRSSVIRQRFAIAAGFGHHVRKQVSSIEHQPSYYTTEGYDIEQAAVCDFAIRLLADPGFMYYLYRREGLSIQEISNTIKASQTAIKHSLQLAGTVFN